MIVKYECPQSIARNSMAAMFTSGHMLVAAKGRVLSQNFI